MSADEQTPADTPSPADAAAVERGRWIFLVLCGVIVVEQTWTGLAALRGAAGSAGLLQALSVAAGAALLYAGYSSLRAMFGASLGLFGSTRLLIVGFLCVQASSTGGSWNDLRDAKGGLALLAFSGLWYLAAALALVFHPDVQRFFAWQEKLREARVKD